MKIYQRILGVKGSAMMCIVEVLEQNDKVTVFRPTSSEEAMWTAGKIYQLITSTFNALFEPVPENDKMTKFKLEQLLHNLYNAKVTSNQAMIIISDLVDEARDGLEGIMLDAINDGAETKFKVWLNNLLNDYVEASE